MHECTMFMFVCHCPIEVRPDGVRKRLRRLRRLRRGYAPRARDSGLLNLGCLRAGEGRHGRSALQEVHATKNPESKEWWTLFAGKSNYRKEPARFKPLEHMFLICSLGVGLQSLNEQSLRLSMGRLRRSGVCLTLPWSLAERTWESVRGAPDFRESTF